MNNINNFISYFNPFSDELSKSYADFRNKLDIRDVVITVVASIFAGLIGFGISGIAVFRYTVEKLSKDSDKVTKNVDEVASEKKFQVGLKDALHVKSVGEIVPLIGINGVVQGFPISPLRQMINLSACHVKSREEIALKIGTHRVDLDTSSILLRGCNFRNTYLAELTSYTSLLKN